jgi:serine protease Do
MYKLYLSHKSPVFIVFLAICGGLSIQGIYAEESSKTKWKVPFLLPFHLSTSSSPLLDEKTAQTASSLQSTSAKTVSCPDSPPRDFQFAFKKVSPSIVSIASGYRSQSRFKPVNTGTGVLVGYPPYIVTNAHVIQGQKEIRIRTYHRQVIRAQLVGIEPNLDLAVLKVPFELLKKLPSIKLATSSSHPGQWVAAIGHPYQMPYSLSTGAISALYRSDLRQWKGRFPGFIQTDLTLNPGNSGGPLVNRCGEMIGLNTAILDSGQGLSFALPLNRILPVAYTLIQRGYFKKSYIGLKLKNVSYSRAEQVDLDPRMGVRVRKVVEGSPASRAGLKVNDIILSVNHEPINHAGELSWIFISSPVYEPLNLMVIRGDEYTKDTHEPHVFETFLIPLPSTTKPLVVIPSSSH